MAAPQNTELIETFDEFYRQYYRDKIGELAQKYPFDKKSLFVDWQDLYQFDPDLADDFRSQPEPVQEYAEEALRLFDLPVDVKLGQAHVRIMNLPETTAIRNIRADHRGQLISVQGVVRKATEVRPKVTDAAFECQRCGTLTRIPQTAGDFQEPNKCQGCERQGPFRLNYDQSEFIDAQRLVIANDPNKEYGVSDLETVEVVLEDDITGTVAAGDRVTAVCVVALDQQDEAPSSFDVYLQCQSIKPRNPDRSISVPTDEEISSQMEEYTTRATRVLVSLPEDAREEETKAKLITPFIRALGWDLFDNDMVRMEYTDEKTSNRPDYALFGTEADTPDVIIEAKQWGTYLPSHEDQLCDYLRIHSTSWGVLTDGEEFHIYKNPKENDSVPTKLAELSQKHLPDADILSELHRKNFRK